MRTNGRGLRRDMGGEVTSNGERFLGDERANRREIDELREERVFEWARERANKRESESEGVVCCWNDN